MRFECHQKRGAAVAGQSIRHPEGVELSGQAVSPVGQRVAVGGIGVWLQRGDALPHRLRILKDWRFRWQIGEGNECRRAAIAGGFC